MVGSIAVESPADINESDVKSRSKGGILYYSIISIVTNNDLYCPHLPTDPCSDWPPVIISNLDKLFCNSCIILVSLNCVSAIIPLVGLGTIICETVEVISPAIGTVD